MHTHRRPPTHTCTGEPYIKLLCHTMAYNSFPVKKWYVLCQNTQCVILTNNNNIQIKILAIKTTE